MFAAPDRAPDPSLTGDGGRAAPANGSPAEGGVLSPPPSPEVANGRLPAVTKAHEAPQPAPSIAAPFVSICIAACNEAPYLEAVIRHLQTSSVWQARAQDGRREILICVNGSTDGSVEVAQAIAERHPPGEMRVLVEEEKGKSRAWERLVRESHSEAAHLFFVDCDIQLRVDTLATLSNHLTTKPDIAAVGAWVLPLPGGNGLTYYHRWLLAFHRLPETREFWAKVPDQCLGVSGQCYAIRRDVAVPFRMPRDGVGGYMEAIMEDAFLNASLRERCLVVRDAVCWQKISSLWDGLKRHTRFFHSRELMREHFPELTNPEWPPHPTVKMSLPPLPARIFRLAFQYPLAAKLGVISNLLMHHGATLLLKLGVARALGWLRWPSVPSTKMPASLREPTNPLAPR